MYFKGEIQSVSVSVSVSVVCVCVPVSVSVSVVVCVYVCVRVCVCVCRARSLSHSLCLQVGLPLPPVAPQAPAPVVSKPQLPGTASLAAFGAHTGSAGAGVGATPRNSRGATETHVQGKLLKQKKLVLETYADVC